MEQEITHYSRGKLHVDQITVRESARSTKYCLGDLINDLGTLGGYNLGNMRSHRK
jgi:hypothetical protein